MTSCPLPDDGAPAEPGPRTTGRRLTSVLACVFVTGLALSGLTVILPLYATGPLGLTNAQYARLLSLRTLGICLGVVVLGALGDRFGPRRVTLLCLPPAGVLMAAMGLVPLAGVIVILPILSGLLSTSFVNLNHLTQLVDHGRQGRANSLYRAVGIFAGVVAPVAATQLLAVTGRYWPVFTIIGTALGLGAVFVARYPMTEPSNAFQGWRQEARKTAGIFAGALRERHLMRFMHVVLLLAALGSAVTAFAAIRLTDELGTSKTSYGSAASVGAVVSLAAILALGVVLDRLSIKWTVIALMAWMAGAMVAMGLNASGFASAACYVAFLAGQGVYLGPMSIWVSREAGRAGLGASFATHKVLTAVYFTLAALAFSFVEPWIGITGVFLACGALSVPLLAVMALLREPAGRVGPADEFPAEPVAEAVPVAADRESEDRDRDPVL